MDKAQYDGDPLTADEFQAWKHQNTSQKVFFLLSEAKQMMIDGMTLGGTLRFDNADQTAQMTARQVGVIEGINKILEMEVTEE